MCSKADRPVNASFYIQVSQWHKWSHEGQETRRDTVNPLPELVFDTWTVWICVCACGCGLFPAQTASVAASY